MGILCVVLFFFAIFPPYKRLDSRSKDREWRGRSGNDRDKSDDKCWIYTQR